MTEVLRFESDAGCWEMRRRAPAPALRGIVAGAYCGWSESVSPAPVRRELPTAKVPLIFDFGAGYRVGGPGQPIADAPTYQSFAAGLYESFAETQACGPTIGVQVDLTPLGAFRLLGLPMSELAGRGVSLAEALGRDGGSFIERLAESRDWERRFALVDAELTARLRAAPAPAPSVEWAWSRLASTGGTAAIAPLAHAVGWSQKHLIARFREQVGLAPKRLARVLRFERFTGRLRGARRHGWATLALDCGYYDQAHLNRDCRAFAGCTPRQLAARMLPGGGWAGG